MEHFLLSVNAVVPMFLLMAAGMLAKKMHVLTKEDVPRFNRVAFQIFIPCLLFYNVYTSELSAAVRPKLILYAVCGVLLVFGAAILLVTHFVPHQDRRGVIAQGIFRSNYVLMGLPIAEVLVGSENLGPISILIAIIVPLFNLLAVVTLESFRGGRVKPGTVLLGIAKNPFVIGSVLGILSLLLKVRLPALLEQCVHTLGSIGTPLQLFLLGAFFQFSGLSRYRRALTAVTLIKLVITPAVMLGTAAAIGFRGVEFVSLIGVFASPTAVNSFTMVQQMHCGDAELAGDIVVCTSAFSLFSFFVWIMVFKSLGVF
ncbi:MAG: AEC family transporter [Oscillospiraceae bacterium]|nr:AEC family transporter [Oscillospiraceae bacterium]